jgi:hypothetical protein
VASDRARELSIIADGATGFARAPWLTAWRLLEPELGLSLDALAASEAPERLDRLNRVAVSRGLFLRAEQPLRFIAQTEAQTEAGGQTLAMSYEQAVATFGAVPTRVNGPGALHDLLNALAWLCFPRVKAVLHQLQATEIARDGIGAARGRLRDGVTLLDENGIFLVVRNPVDATRLRERAWDHLLFEDRARWGAEICAVPLGHGLVERLVRPYPALTSHVRALRLPPAWFALPPVEQILQLDRVAAVRLRARPPLPGALDPLPVLGIPGWWADNLDPAFYRDTRVFRPRPA